MSEPLGTLSPLLVPTLVAYASLVDPAWPATLGVLGMGLWDILGREEPAQVDVAPDGGDDEDDFLSGGGFGDPTEEETDGADDGFGDDDDMFAEVEPRLSDLEGEIEDLSSTVTTIKADHESMRESVEGVEENVRKLLEVYEVVTQGANPFADGPGMTGSGGGAFDLLEGEGEPADEGADDESLFDAAEDEPAEEGIEPDEEGKTFEDLKSEFELDDEPEDDPADDDLDDAEEEVLDEPVADEGADEPDDGSEPPSEPDVGKPYLTALPAGFGGELLVMEWLDFLVGETSPQDANRALRFYRTVEWVDDGVAEELQAVLAGVTADAARATADGGRPGQLSIEHHAQSLEYISRLCELGGGSMDPAGVPDASLDGIDFEAGEHGVQR